VRTLTFRYLVIACERLEWRRDILRGAIDDLVRLEHERLEGGRAAGERARNRRPQREDDLDSGSRSEKGEPASGRSARPGPGVAAAPPP
jgi:hypothetical protein